jgi:hypothetical protein
MSDDYLAWDALRVGLAVAALWLGVLVLRLGWIHRHDRRKPGAVKPHLATYVSYAMALMTLAAFRLGHVGEPPTWGLIPTAVCIGLGLWGVLARVKLPRVPPHRR